MEKNFKKELIQSALPTYPPAFSQKVTTSLYFEHNIGLYFLFSVLANMYAFLSYIYFNFAGFWGASI